MKSILKCATLFLIMLAFSCSSSDGGSKTKVKYVIHADTPIITNITYMKADGTTATVTDQGGPDWEQTVNVDKPFNATMTVSFDNIANTVSDYFLVIYVNGSSEPSAYVPGQVPPNGMNSGTISFQVD